MATGAGCHHVEPRFHHRDLTGSTSHASRSSITPQYGWREIRPWCWATGPPQPSSNPRLTSPACANPTPVISPDPIPNPSSATPLTPERGRRARAGLRRGVRGLGVGRHAGRRRRCSDRLQGGGDKGLPSMEGGTWTGFGATPTNRGAVIHQLELRLHRLGSCEVLGRRGVHYFLPQHWLVLASPSRPSRSSSRSVWPTTGTR